MTKICNKCKKPAVIFVRYNGIHLCKDHFVDYFERRVKKEIKEQGKTKKPSKIGVAISGGKDSSVALHVMHSIFSNRRDVELLGLTVDEGIKGYRDKSIEFAKENCKILGIEHSIVSFKEIIGFTLDEIALKKDEIGECSYCGVFRRVCLNKIGKELEIDRLTTGHNLDDIAQSILMNFVGGDIKKLTRIGPHKKVHKGLIPRMAPLRTIPEKESMLYAILKGIPFYYGECPYSIRAKRGIFRYLIDELEYKTPGTKYAILSSYNAIKDILEESLPSIELNKCNICKEPTSQEICKACLLKKRLFKNNYLY